MKGLILLTREHIVRMLLYFQSDTLQFADKQCFMIFVVLQVMSSKFGNVKTWVGNFNIIQSSLIGVLLQYVS